MKLNRNNWDVVARPVATPEAYALALRDAKSACNLAPNTGYTFNTLGVAHYRVGEFQKALDTLSRSDQIQFVVPAGRCPEDVAFLAIAQNKLGHKDEEESSLTELRQLIETKWSNNSEAERFLKEAETLIGSKRGKKGLPVSGFGPAPMDSETPWARSGSTLVQEYPVAQSLTQESRRPGRP